MPVGPSWGETRVSAGSGVESANLVMPGPACWAGLSGAGAAVGSAAVGSAAVGSGSGNCLAVAAGVALVRLRVDRVRVVFGLDGSVVVASVVVASVVVASVVVAPVVVAPVDAVCETVGPLAAAVLAGARRGARWRAGAAGVVSVSVPVSVPAGGVGGPGRASVVAGSVVGAGVAVVGVSVTTGSGEVAGASAGGTGWADNWSTGAGFADCGSPDGAVTGGGSEGMANVASSPRDSMTPKNGTVRCQARSWVAHFTG
ncbi:hypothetical protein BCD49_01500 [Pseudofrankia sp. EUN1h]|nr:hypothetical protein BCD49_01500 [Pseudofrankia sp. EUN1h]